jgi:hypothetical protein
MSFNLGTTTDCLFFDPSQMAVPTVAWQLIEPAAAALKNLS